MVPWLLLGNFLVNVGFIIVENSPHVKGCVVENSIGKRIKEERERLGYDQETFAALSGSSRFSQIDWEKGKSFPNAKVLSAYADVGADVQYILTGIKAASLPTSTITLTSDEVGLITQSLSMREATLLDHYRHIADEEDRKAVERTAFIAARPMNKDETQSRTQKKAG